MSLFYGNCGSTRRLRRNLHELLDGANGVVQRAWRIISRCIAWIISSRRGMSCLPCCSMQMPTPFSSRYPTFIDAVRDIDDALCLIFLFASLPSNNRLPKSLVENCARLSAEWQLYVMHKRALRKVFLSIKGVYFQAEVMDQTVTWLVPYQFTQSVSP